MNVSSDFLSNRKQTKGCAKRSDVFLNKIGAGIPQGSIFGPLLLLIYINDFSDSLSSNVKVFAEKASLFLVKCDISASANELNSDLKKINDWASQSKMSFKEY